MSWNTLYSAEVEVPDIVPGGYEAFTALPGKVIVEMAEKPESRRSVLLPDIVSAKLRPDVGVVLACCPPIDSYGGQMVMDIQPGQVVMVRPGDGEWFMQGFTSPKYTTKREVRCFGVHGSASLYQVTEGEMGDRKDCGEKYIIPWHESIVAKLSGKTVIPTLGNVLVRPVRKNPYNLILPEGTKLPTTECVIEETNRYSPLKKGQIVAYEPEVNMDLLIEGEDIYLIQEDQVLSLVEVGDNRVGSVGC